MPSIDNLELLEERVTKLESLVGNFEKLNQTKGLDTIIEISNRLNDYLNSNPKIGAAIKAVNDINKYTIFDVLGEIEDENLLNSKLELILYEEDYIRKLNQDFEKLKNLTKILDDKTLNDVTTLNAKLKDLAANQAKLKENESTYTKEIREFLSTYYSTMNTIQETMDGINGYLDQFDDVKRTTDKNNDQESFESFA